ncbi:MAG: hypothetical protein P8X57_11745, partial [Cyclobacteriaceae bacterium]
MNSGFRNFLPVFLVVILAIPYSHAQQPVFRNTATGVAAVRFCMPGQNINELALFRQHASRQVAGEWTEINSDTIQFRPFYDLPFGEQYSFRKNGEELFKFKTPEGKAGNPQILAVHPEADTLPVNLLKMQIVFDRPMQAGVGMNYLFWSESGQKIDNLFIKLSPELWNKGYDTLTMWLDPGRIKRDLIPNRERGNPLSEWREYTLHILPGWTASDGGVLLRGHSKTFVAGSYDTSRLAPETWELKLPEANSNEDLILQTDGILDLYSVTGGLRITDISGREIEGKYETGQGEVIRFSPSKNWKSGE